METLPRLTNSSRLSTSPILQAPARGNNGITLDLAVKIICRLNTYIRNFRIRQQARSPAIISCEQGVRVAKRFSFSYKGNNFEVVEAKEDERDSVVEEMSRWINVCEARFDALERSFGPESDETIARRKRYSGISRTCDDLKDCTPTGVNIILSRCEGKTQAVATCSKDNSSICYLVSNPENVKDPANTNPIAGGGTSIIAYLAQKNLLQGTDLTLRARGRAIPFYERLQFERVETPRGFPKFILTAQKIRALIEQGIPPFDQLRTGTSSEVQFMREKI